MESHPRKPRRDKYISRACRACQGRKTKCSGHDPCSSCQDRGLTCVYNRGKRRPKKSTAHAQRKAPERTSISLDEHGAIDQEALNSTEIPPMGFQNIENMQTETSPLFDRRSTARRSTKVPSTGASLYTSRGPDTNHASLRSQISEVRALFTTKEDSISGPKQELYSRKETHSIELPDYSTTQECVQLYFENTGRQYPALHQTSTISHINEILDYLRYPSRGLKLEIDYFAATTIALLCIMLALVEMTRTNTTVSEKRDRAMHFGNQSRSLLRTFELLPPDLQIIRCHTLTTIYLLQMDFLDLASQSIAITVRLVMTLQLHKPCLSPKKRSDSYDQNLWWTIYVLDRTIAYLGGTPSFIRDDKIQSPRPAHDGQYHIFSDATYINKNDARSQLEERCFSRDFGYLEALAYLGRLWDRIWDSLVTNTSELDCEWQEAEILDVQLRVFQQRLPPALIWNTTSITDDLDKEEERAAQLRLVTLMALNSMRLFIRRNPTSNCTCLDKSNPGTDGLIIARQTVEAIATLSSTHESLLVPIGHSISTTLVQCILYLLTIISKSTNTSTTESASASVVSAYKILQDLSDGCLSAGNAIETLDASIFCHGDGPIRPNTPRHDVVTSPQGSTTGMEDPHGLGLVQMDSETQNRIFDSSPRSSHANSFISYLQQSYESLDNLPTVTSL